MTDRPALRPKEGWHVLHLFYRVEFGQWQVLTSEERLAAKTKLSALVQEIRSLPATQILTFSIVSPKADIGFMLLTDDLHTANSIEKKLTFPSEPDVLTPVFSFYSLTERQRVHDQRRGLRRLFDRRKGLLQRLARVRSGNGRISGADAKISPGPPLSQHAGLACFLLLPDDKAKRRRSELVRSSF